MARKVVFDVRLSATQSMDRLRGTVRRESTFWFPAYGCRDPKPLMGRLGERTFHLFAGKRYSRLMPLFATGEVAPAPEGCRVEARIGLRAWDVLCCLFCVALLTVAAVGGSRVILSRDGPGGPPLVPVALVASVWLLGMGVLAADWCRNHKEAPLLARALKDVFADVLVAEQEPPSDDRQPAPLAPE